MPKRELNDCNVADCPVAGNVKIVYDEVWELRNRLDNGLFDRVKGLEKDMKYIVENMHTSRSRNWEVIRHLVGFAMAYGLAVLTYSTIG